MVAVKCSESLSHKLGEKEEESRINSKRQQENFVRRVLVENNETEHFIFENAKEKAIL